MKLLALLLLSVPARAQDLSLRDVLVSAERFSPEVRAALAAEDKARADVGLRESALYPTLEAQGIQSYGFPGSNGALGLGGCLVGCLQISRGSAAIGMSFRHLQGSDDARVLKQMADSAARGTGQ